MSIYSMGKLTKEQGATIQGYLDIEEQKRLKAQSQKDDEEEEEARLEVKKTKTEVQHYKEALEADDN